MTSLFCFYLKFKLFCTNTFKNLSAQIIQLFLLFLKQSGTWINLFPCFFVRDFLFSHPSCLDSPFAHLLWYALFSPQKLCIIFAFNVSWVLQWFPTEIKIKLQPKKLNGPRKSRCIDEIFYVHHVTVTWLMWCLRYFQFECLLHLQSQAAQALHLKLDEFEFSRYFIEINKENTSLKLPVVCSCGGLVWQNVLPLNYLKVGFKWLSTQCCAFAICISSIIPWALTICKDISVKKVWQMVLVLKTFAKREMCWSCTICKTPENVWERNVSELYHLQNTR